MSRYARPKSVLITGATGGIGSALAVCYAAPGVRLVLHGRRQAQLAALATRCTAAGADVLTAVGDVRERPQFRAWLAEICTGDAPDLVLVTAGLNTHVGAQGEAEDWASVEALLEVNVWAAMATVDAVLPAMRRRGHGQIALFSSLAAFHGLPLTPSYSASKAAIKAYGEALRGWLAPEGIAVNVVMPGYVDSLMCREMPGPKPCQWPAERAARVIQARLRANPARLSFPRLLAFGCWWLAVLPAAVSSRLLRVLRYVP